MRTAALGFLLLAGCAANQVRLEIAGDVSTKAKATTAAASAYVADVQARRREAAVALVASDPTCTWGSSIVMDLKWDPAKTKRGLCDMRGVPPSRQVTVNLQPVSDQGLKAITAAIAGIAAYQGALADILDEKPIDAKAEISSAIDTLTTASSDINRIAGSKVIDLGVLSSDPAKAVVDLIGTLVQLKQTDLKVRRVRGVIESHNATKLLDMLSTAVIKLNRLQDANSATYKLFALDAAYSRERTMLRFDERVQRVHDLAIAADEVTDGKVARIAGLQKAIKDLRTSNDELEQAVLHNEISAERRKQVARENRKQIFSILSQVAAFFPAV